MYIDVTGKVLGITARTCLVYVAAKAEKAWNSFLGNTGSNIGFISSLMSAHYREYEGDNTTESRERRQT